MPISTVYTYTNLGLIGHRISIEVDSNKSLPTIEIIGLPDTAIKESKERIRATFRNSDIMLPPKKIIVNLAPSHLRKVGTRFDVPIAVAIYSVITALTNKAISFLHTAVFFGELGLDGTIKEVSGIVPSIVSAMEDGYTVFFVPERNIREIVSIPGITIYPLTDFGQLVRFLQGVSTLDSVAHIPLSVDVESDLCVFGHVKGHAVIKRALTVAAAGMHNILLVGPPGSGKSMLAKATSMLLPPLTYEESLEISKIYSIAGIGHGSVGLSKKRPFRKVHHTASKVSIVGGGQFLTPGEISLSHRGVLFFDELPEFPREVLEVLRQPLEDNSITISRAQGKVDYPADFMFVAAMNPCKCGYYKDKQKPCTCNYNDIKRYQSKISGPLLDRFDMILEVPRTDIGRLLSTENEKHTDTHPYRKEVLIARKTQKKRYHNEPITMNSQLGSNRMHSHIQLGEKEREFLENVARSYVLSPRVVHRLLRVSRTIADMSNLDKISIEHIAEAIQYRGKTMFVE